VLSVYYDKICIKFASYHLLLYVVYMCQKSLNFTYAFKCYQQNVSGFTLAGPPCIYGEVRVVGGDQPRHWILHNAWRGLSAIAVFLVRFRYGCLVVFGCVRWTKLVTASL